MNENSSGENPQEKAAPAVLPPLTVTCRPARAEDTDDMVELTKTIWDGEDYVPQVWAEWLQDSEGLLAVAEYESRVLGLGHLARLSDEDWWMEGIRVHPQYEGRRIASQVHDYMIDYWLQHGGGTLRLGTASDRIPVHRMCARRGLVKVVETSFFKADALMPAEDQAFDFSPLVAEDLGEAVAFARLRPAVTWNAGLIYLDWRTAPPSESRLLTSVEAGRAFWWHGRQALLALLPIDETDPDQVKVLMLMLLAGEASHLTACLGDSRFLAHRLGYTRIAWMAPLHPELLPVLEQAGFLRDWDEALYYFALEHPKTSLRSNDLP